MRPLCTTCLLVVLVIPPILFAQTPAPPPDSGQHIGPPGPPGDALFYRGMALLALDEKAGLLVDAGNPDAAIAELRKVYDYDIPKDHPAFEVKVRLIGELATLYVDRGSKDQAVETIQALLKDVAPGTPAEAAAWFAAGKTYRAAGMTEDALAAFDRAIEVSNELAKLAPERCPKSGGGPPGMGPGEPAGRRPPPPPGDESW